MSRTIAPPSFVGRRTEIDWLLARLSDGLRGLPQLLLISGDAGIGKSRLLKEFQERARGQGVYTCYGRAYENLALPYVPFDRLFRLIDEAPEGHIGDERETIRAFFAGRTRTGSQEAGVDDRDTRARLFVALGRAILQLATAQPVLIVLDDLHWADRPSLDLFSHLSFSLADAAGLEEARILIAASYRPLDARTEPGHAVARLRREPICRTLELAGLDETAVQQLISNLGLERASHQLIDTVVHATRGNPLFVQHMVDRLQSSGGLEERGGYILSTLPPEQINVPPDLTSAIEESVDALPDPCQQALSMASLLGNSIALADLALVADQQEDMLAAALEPAVQQRLLRTDGRTFEFDHPLVQQVCAARFSAVRRQRMHLRIAEVLTRLVRTPGLARPLEVAHHLLAAGSLADPDELIRWATEAGDRSLDLFAWADAARFYRASAMALSGKDDLPSVRRRAELHFRAARAFTRAFDPGPSQDHFERAVADFSETGDLHGLARALVERARNQITLNSVPYGTLLDVAPLERALEQLGDHEDVLRASLLEVLANVYWTGRDPIRATACAQSALELSERLGDSVLSARASGALALAHMQSLRVREWADTCERSAEYSRHGGDLWFYGQRLVRVPMAILARGRLAEAVPIAREGFDVTRRTHNWGEHSLALANLVMIDVTHGDFDAAEEHARGVMSMIERSGYPWAGPIALPALACARYLTGASREAEDAIEILIEPGRVFRETGNAYASAVRLYRRLIRGHANGVTTPSVASPSGAGSQTRRVSEIGSLFRYCAEIELADSSRDAKAADDAFRTLREAAACGVVVTTGWVFLLPRIIGLGAALRESWEEARESFAKALDIAEREGARPELARTHFDLARMLASREDREGAVEHLERAHALFSELGMAHFAARASVFAASLGVSLSTVAAAAGPPSPFSEAELARRIATGCTNLEIARDLLVSAKTVEDRRATLLAKADVAGVTTLAASTAPHDRTQAGPVRVRRPPHAGSPPTTLDSQTRVICFTDLVRSTELITDVGDVAARQLLFAHEQIIRECVRAHAGEEIQHTGDGFMLAFRSAASALDCSIGIQRGIDLHNEANPERPLRVRIGLNAGEPIVEPGRLFGAAVHLAARICAQAGPCQILVSEVVRELARGTRLEFSECGIRHLKGFPEEFRLFELSWARKG